MYFEESEARKERGRGGRAPEKPVETFLGGESYHPTSQGEKRTSEAPTASTTEIEGLVKLMEEMAHAPKEEYGKREPGERQASEIYYERRNETSRAGN